MKEINIYKVLYQSDSGYNFLFLSSLHKKKDPLVQEVFGNSFFVI